MSDRNFRPLGGFELQTLSDRGRHYLLRQVIVFTDPTATWRSATPSTDKLLDLLFALVCFHSLTCSKRAGRDERLTSEATSGIEEHD